MTPSAYRDWQAQSPIRHEYRAGEVWAMSGNSYAHAIVCGALHALLWQHLRGRGCRVAQSDLMVEVGPRKRDGQ